MKLEKLEVEIEGILKNNPKAKSDDMYLYYVYCTSHWIRDTDMYRVFADSNCRKEKGISPFESVSRARRKLQAGHEELRPDEVVQDARFNKTSEFIDYAIDGYSSNFMDYVDSQD